MPKRQCQKQQVHMVKISDKTQEVRDMLLDSDSKKSLITADYESVDMMEMESKYETDVDSLVTLIS